MSEAEKPSVVEISNHGFMTRGVCTLYTYKFGCGQNYPWVVHTRHSTTVESVLEDARRGMYGSGNLLQPGEFVVATQDGTPCYLMVFSDGKTRAKYWKYLETLRGTKWPNTLLEPSTEYEGEDDEQFDLSNI